MFHTIYAAMSVYAQYGFKLCIGLSFWVLVACDVSQPSADNKNTPQAFQADKHYQHYRGFQLTGVAQPLQTPSVVEFFSYGCMHCQKLAPKLVQWQTEQKALNMQYLPIIWNEKSELYAKVFLIIRGHENFAALHAAMFELTKSFMRTDTLGDQQVAFVQKLNALGIPPEITVEALTGDALAPQLNAILVDIKDFQITGVPTLIVNGQHKILNDSLSSNAQMLDVAEFLLAQPSEQ